MITDAGISEREMEKYKAEAEAQGKGSFAFAFVMDRQKEERARGVTIACTTKEFFTPNYHYTIIDAPGHRDFIKNMITGAGQADVALLMVPADGNFTVAIQRGDHKQGEVQGQTRQHSRLLFLLGCQQLFVGVNKMDSKPAGPYSQERFVEIANEMANMLQKTGWKKDFIAKSVPILPISGWMGDNLIKQSENMKWWQGKEYEALDKSIVKVTTLHDALDLFAKLPKRECDACMRCPVSGVYKIKGVGDVITGRIEQGVLEVGRDVVFLPQNSTGKVFTIEMHHNKLDKGMTGHNVGINMKNIDKANPPTTGSVIIYKDDLSLRATKTFRAQVQVLDIPNQIKVKYSPIGFVRTGRSACKIVKIIWKLGKETGNKKLEVSDSEQDSVYLKTNDSAYIEFEPTSDFVCEPFAKCQGLSRIAFMDGNSAVMLGRIMDVAFKEPPSKK